MEHSLTPKKVGIISGLFGTKDVGGAEMQLYYLSCEFSRMGHEVHVIASEESNVSTQALKEKGVQLHLLPAKVLHTGRFKLDFYWKAWSEITKIRPDMCIVRTLPLAFIGLLYAKRYGKKFIYSVTADKDVLRRNLTDVRNVHKIIFRRAGQIALRFADSVVAQTEYQKRCLKENFNIESVVIRNGHPLPKNGYLKGHPPIVLWLANLRREKRVDIFLDLAWHFRDWDCQFAVAGKAMDAGCSETLDEAIKKQRNITYYGALQFDEALDLVGKASVLVNTSDIEGFPNVFVEAWMRETPTISLNIDPDNIIKRNAMGFHSGSLENMAKNLATLLSNKALLRTMGENAKKYATEHHDLEVVAKMYGELF
jgi:glycosyltransferase involved in cell wall biosynthesis